jgi:hypothetical protein
MYETKGDLARPLSLLRVNSGFAMTLLPLNLKFIGISLDSNRTTPGILGKFIDEFAILIRYTCPRF